MITIAKDITEPHGLDFEHNPVPVEPPKWQATSAEQFRRYITVEGALYSVDSHAVDARELFLEARKRAGWGPGYSPPIEDQEAFGMFRDACLDLRDRFSEFKDMLAESTPAEEMAGPTAEILASLNRLYDVPWAPGELLKQLVVAVLSQLNNTDWTAAHIAFLSDVVEFLCALRLITDDSIEYVFKVIAAHGLDQFRGAVSGGAMNRHYKIVEIEGDSESDLDD